MPTSRRVLTSAAVAALTFAAAVTPATAAPAKHGDSSRSVQVSAACGSIATTLTLRARNSGVEAEYQLDENRNGKTWKLRLSRNGQVLARARRTTIGPSGALHWRVLAVGVANTDALQVTARRRTATCVISGSINASGGGQSSTTSPAATPTPAPSASSTASGANVDTIEVSKCYTNATKKTGGELLIKASSSDPTAKLLAYRPDGSLIGEVQNGGGSRYGGSVMPYQPNDPGTVTIKSSSGGSVTVPTGPFQL
ncbi:MAG: hypothetical protein WCP95_13000 [Actinomycetes bacterium]